MRITRQVSAVALMLMTFVALPASGEAHIEYEDADQQLATAQEVADGTTAIEGTCSTSYTDIDLYRVCLEGNQTFSASTYIEDGGESSGDPMLMLFDEQGHGIYYSNNIASDIDDARLPAGHTLTPIAGGIYYLAITGGGYPLGRFDRPVVGVGGSTGGGTPALTWVADVTPPGPYRIALTGLCGALPTFAVSDFLPPINPSAVNNVKAGGVVAVKWLLTDGDGNPVDDP